MSSCGRLFARSSQIGGDRGFQQNLRDSIFRSGLWTSMASDAYALFATAHPEVSALALQGFSAGIDEFELDRLFAGNLHEKGAIPLNPSSSE
jgi:hypothetical protein